MFLPCLKDMLVVGVCFKTNLTEKNKAFYSVYVTM